VYAQSLQIDRLESILIRLNILGRKDFRKGQRKRQGFFKCEKEARLSPETRIGVTTLADMQTAKAPSYYSDLEFETHSLSSKPSDLSSLSA
jgi:hypothetical protein